MENIPIDKVKSFLKRNDIIIALIGVLITLIGVLIASAVFLGISKEEIYAGRIFVATGLLLFLTCLFSAYFYKYFKKEDNQIKKNLTILDFIFSATLIIVICFFALPQSFNVTIAQPPGITEVPNQIIVTGSVVGDLPDDKELRLFYSTDLTHEMVYPQQHIDINSETKQWSGKITLDNSYNNCKTFYIMVVKLNDSDDSNVEKIRQDGIKTNIWPNAGLPQNSEIMDEIVVRRYCY